MPVVLATGPTATQNSQFISLAATDIIASTQCTELQRDGQAEWA